MDDHRPMQRMHRSRDVIGPKSKIPIRLKCNDGSELVGYVHVCGQERIRDLVNDSRPFLPFETNEGKIAKLRRGESWRDIGALKRDLIDLWLSERNAFAKGTMQDIREQERQPLRLAITRPRAQATASP